MKTLLDMMSLFAPSTTHVVADMKTLADFLLLQQQQYRPISAQYLTYYCFENEPTLLPGGSAAVIVSQVSAVPPSATKSQRIEMHADHIGISKFESVDDRSFQALIAPVQAIVEDSCKRCQEHWQRFQGEFGPFGRYCLLLRSFTGVPLPITKTKIACDLKGKISATPSFEGRNDILLKMHECFDRNTTSLELGRQRRFVLHGLGGTGKTQLMCKFIEQASDQ